MGARRFQRVGGRVRSRRFPCVAHLGGRDRRVVGQHDVLGHGPGAGEGAHALREIGAAERGDHARAFERGGDVDPVDAGVRHGAAQDRQVQHPRGVDVVGPTGLSGEQPGVLLAEPGRADLGHVVPPLLGGFGGGQHGPHDVLVARAAAEVAFQGVTHLVRGRVRVLAQQIARRHEHARGAVAALERVPLAEGTLEAGPLPVPGQSLHRGHFAPVRLDGEHRAALDARTVEVDGAGPAGSGSAEDEAPPFNPLPPGARTCCTSRVFAVARSRSRNAHCVHVQPGRNLPLSKGHDASCTCSTSGSSPTSTPVRPA